MADRLLCVSVDLDGLECYHAIHGLPAVGGPQADLHVTVGLARLVELFDELGIRATLFVVGRDLLRDGCARVVSEAAAAGHEIANHTYSHPYDFSRLGGERSAREVELCAEQIRRVTARPPAGFRAPGYHIDDGVARILAEAGYLYDASLLPSPVYYAAKLAVMAAMRLTGRTSRAIAGGPGMTLAPNRPYRMGATYWLPGRGLVELPCTVVPGVRVPFIGTALAMMGERRALAAARVVSLKRFVGLELHAIDVMEAADLGGSELPRHQPDLRIALSRKRGTIRAVLRALLRSGFRAVTLERAARDLFGEPAQPGGAIHRS
jgi:peptidoglycan/xylan/chitin deacetylase (PgdA/CDA1 family)